jgi:hypothetical protein
MTSSGGFDSPTISTAHTTESAKVTHLGAADASINLITNFKRLECSNNFKNLGVACFCWLIESKLI